MLTLTQWHDVFFSARSLLEWVGRLPGVRPATHPARRFPVRQVSLSPDHPLARAFLPQVPVQYESNSSPLDGVGVKVGHTPADTDQVTKMAILSVLMCAHKTPCWPAVLPCHVVNEPRMICCIGTR
jgi:hypothetical protein